MVLRLKYLYLIKSVKACKVSLENTGFCMLVYNLLECKVAWYHAELELTAYSVASLLWINKICMIRDYCHSYLPYPLTL